MNILTPADMLGRVSFSQDDCAVGHAAGGAGESGAGGGYVNGYVSRGLQPGKFSLAAFVELHDLILEQALDLADVGLEAGNGLGAAAYGAHSTITGADAGADAAGGQIVEGGEGTGRDAGVSGGRHGDAYTEGDARSVERTGRHLHVDLSAYALEVSEPDGVEAHGLDILDAFDDLGHGLVAEDTDSELHEL